MRDGTIVSSLQAEGRMIQTGKRQTVVRRARATKATGQRDALSAHGAFTLITRHGHRANKDPLAVFVMPPTQRVAWKRQAAGAASITAVEMRLRSDLHEP